MNDLSKRAILTEETAYPWFQELSGSPIAVSLIVPCYNEEANIIATLDTIWEALSAVGCTYEVIVIDDCSKDQTSAKVKAYQDQFPDRAISLFSRPSNKGLAQNFYDGAFMARGRYYRMVCGDNVEPASTIITILKSMGQADIIIPYHTVADGRGPFRLALSRLYTWLVNSLSGNNINYYNGLPLFRTADVMRYHVETTGFSFQAEFLTRLLGLGLSYQEVAVHTRERLVGTSRALSWRNWLSAGYTLLKIFLRNIRNFLDRRFR